MDLFIALGIFIAFILAPLLRRSQRTNKRRIVEIFVWILFLVWLLYMVKVF